MPDLPEYIGPFEVVSKLGHGGMGVVYKGYDRELHRHVAIKCLADQFADDESVSTRFLREARSVATLSHPNIVPVYTAGEDNGRPYFVMEYIEGESLADRLKRENPLPVAEAVRIVTATAHGLQAAHDAQLTHRDIKPSNLLLDDKGRVRIADFGIARIEGLTRLTATSGLVGTPGYISPEAIAGESDDHRSDIFSLGVVFYEMLAGRAPFTQTSPVQMWRAAVEANYPDVREVNAAVDESTRAILDRMLAPKPDERYQDCNQIIADLEQHFGREGTPIPESPRSAAGTVGRTQELGGAAGSAAAAKADKRKPGPAVGAVVALALVAIAAGATAYLTQFRDRGGDDSVAATSEPAASGADTVTGKPAGGDGNVVGWLLGGDDKADTPASSDPDAAVADNRDGGPATASAEGSMAPGSRPPNPTTDTASKAADSGDSAPKETDPATGDAAADTEPGAALADAGTTTQDTSTATQDSAPPRQTTPPATAARSDGADDPRRASETTPAAKGGEDDAVAAASGAEADAGPDSAADPGTGGAQEQTPRGSATEAETAADDELRTASRERQSSTPAPDKIVVMAVGDSTLAGPVETALENALRSAGHEILNEQFISGIGQHVRGDNVNMAPLRGLLQEEGGRVLVLARIVPVGQRQLQYSGRSRTAYSSQIDVRVFDLAAGTRLDGWQEQVEFTTLNATQKAKRAMRPYIRRLTAQLSRYRG